MDFRLDNYADIFGIILGVVLLVMALKFRMDMKKNEARAWEISGKYITFSAAFFTLGMAFTLSTILFEDNTQRELINLVGNVFWAVAAYYAYRMLAELTKIIEVVMGV